MPCTTRRVIGWWRAFCEGCVRCERCEQFWLVSSGASDGSSQEDCLIGVTSSTKRGMHKVLTRRRREATERVDFAFHTAVSARPWDRTKSAKDVRVVFPDVFSPAAMAEAEATGKTRRLHINKADMQGHSEGCRDRGGVQPDPGSMADDGHAGCRGARS